MTRRPPAVLAAVLLAISLWGRLDASTITDSAPADGSNPDARIRRLPGAGPNRTDVISDRFGFWAPTAVQASPTAPRAPSATAGGSGWEFIGPEGGNIKCIAISPTHPNVVLAGVGDFGVQGLWRSTDGGISWSNIEDIPAVRAITFAPDGTAYIAEDLGVDRGTADGTVWQRIGPSFPGTAEYVTAYAVAVNPSNPNEIWAGIDLTYVGISLVRSRNGGASWQNVTPAGAGRMPATGIAFNSSNTSKVYACFGAGFGGGGVWVSSDGGATWLIRSAGLPRNQMHDIVYDGTRVLVCGGQLFSSLAVGLYASSNDGITWTPLHGTWPTRFVTDIELDPARPGSILATTDRGLFRSLDGGMTWEFGVGGTSAYMMNAVKRLPQSGAILTGTENYGVLRSTDDGGHFPPSSTGMHALNVVSVAANPLDPRELAAGIESYNSGSLFTSHDAGETWTPEPLPPTRWGSLTFTPDGTLYAASHGPSTLAKEGVYRRNTDGSWTSLTPDRGPFYETDVLSIRVSSNDPQLIFASGDDWVTDQAAIWRSADGGTSWNTAYVDAMGYMTNVDISEDGTDLVVLGTDETWNQRPGKVARSTDGGLTWQTISDGFATMIGPRGLAQSPVDPRLFYIASMGYPALYQSTDAGEHWTAKAAAGSGLNDVAFDPSDPRTVYVASFNGPRVSRSGDGGDTFAPFVDGLEPFTYPTSLVATTSDCRELLSASSAGVYRRWIGRPDLSVAADSHMLWPPNHELANLHLLVDVHDACGAAASFVLTSITANEPVAAGDIVGADYGTPDVDFQLRAERSGSGPGRIYTATYTATNANGFTRSASADIVVPHDQSGSFMAGDVEAKAFTTLPTAFGVVEPNPFRLDAGVSFTLAGPQTVNLEVYDARGVMVRRLVAAEIGAGRHRVTWDGRTRTGSLAASGVYWIRLTTADGQWTRRAALIR